MRTSYVHKSSFAVGTSLSPSAAGGFAERKPDGIKILGSSIHSVSDAQEAERLGADYLTAGHIYATDCKAGVPPRGLDFLEEVCRSVQIPVYGIGGVRIGSGQLDEMMARGAAGACVMSGMMRL